MLTISVDRKQQVPCLFVNGRIDTLTSNDFDETAGHLVTNQRFLIVDLKNCTYLSSNGIRSFLKVEKILKPQNGGLLLVGTKPEVYSVFEMAGLHNVFSFSNSVDEALVNVKTKIESEKCCSEFEYRGGKVSIQATSNNDKLYLWGHCVAGYNELGWSIGFGALDGGLMSDTKGVFVTMQHCAGFIPLNTGVQPDYRIVQDLSDGVMEVDNALSFDKGADVLMRYRGSEKLSADELNMLVQRGFQHSGNKGGRVHAAVVADNNPEGPSLSFVLFYNSDLFEFLRSDSSIVDAYFDKHESGRSIGVSFLLDKMQTGSNDQQLTENLKNLLTFENIKDVAAFDFSKGLINPVVYGFNSNSVANATGKLLHIEAAGDYYIPEEYKLLCRKLYNDSQRIVLKKLHGGFSAQTYQVASFDAKHRKLRPTVLKIADKAMITREADRCRENAMPYILNNSAMVLGTSFFGNRGALRYNFVGIGGENSRLKWLAYYYQNWPAEKLESLFDKIFLDILKPWYGQPVESQVYPFREHNPTHAFFSNLIETAENEFQLSSDDKLIELPEDKGALVNPYWFLKYKYSELSDVPVDFYVSICHGDLNMQNILLDEDMNVYLIDFSETRQRSIVSDFARLEAIFMMENINVENREDWNLMLQLYRKIYADEPFGQHFNIDDSYPEAVRRNVLMSRKMRGYALKSAVGKSVELPYYMALLEWVLPVVCYGTASDNEKRLSMIVAGWLCEKVLNSGIMKPELG
ncbi:MAG: STAS domain-containing protein [Prolixibacteraceae bacterium]|nr:STAS domain-containing protein [Prolixibacteraceae bacterium]